MTNFLGLDFSTQRLKAVVVDENLKIIHKSNVHFDTQLPEFRTHGGVVRGEKGLTTSPVVLWIKALDLLLDQMKLSGVDFSKIRALSGAAQQHGSVYWQNNARARLNDLDPFRFLHEQLQTCFALQQSPSWLDSSTTKYCREMDAAVGGPEKMAEITGSRAFERFTGPQVAKIVAERFGVYENTERISLISSFSSSLFLGDYADVDYADASGMNLMDIRTKQWDKLCVNAVKGPDLEKKLGTPVPPHSDLGKISKYFAERFDFNPNCRVVSFTGDNPASLAGLRMSENDIAVSLGTSDTVMLPLSEPKVLLNAHVFVSPTHTDGFLGMLCFKNASLTRERLRNQHANGCWETFDHLLNSTPRGNFGNIALYLDAQEILPFLGKGEYRVNGKGQRVTRFASPEIEIRALIEGQFLAQRAYSEELGLPRTETKRIVATGGGSRNKTILQVLADVFNIPVYAKGYAYSAALGSAVLAKMGVEKDLSFEDTVKHMSEFEFVCTPNKDASQIYDPMVNRYRSFVSDLLKEQTVAK